MFDARTSELTTAMSSPSQRPHNHRAISAPRRASLSPLLSSSSLGLSDSPDITRRGSLGGLEPRFWKRGLALEEVEEYGLVSSEERSKDFEGMPISEDEIKKLPKKVS